MNDEETVALIAGGHTFGKAHGAGAESNVGPEPEGATLEEQGFGWKNSHGSGKAGDTFTSGLEGAWTNDPVKWDNNFFENLHNHEWELTNSPAGKSQYEPTDAASVATVPDAHDPAKKHAPMMLTTDLSLREDPVYGPIAKRFLENFRGVRGRLRQGVVQADSPRHGAPQPLSRVLWFPPKPLLWQDPVPGGRPRADRGAGNRRAQGEGPRLGTVRFPSWSRPHGRRPHRSAAPTSAAGPTARASGLRRKGIGK